MGKNKPKKRNGKRLEILMAIVLITITAIAVIYLLQYPDQKDQSQDNIIRYTQFYTNISVQTASDLINSSINTSYNLSVIDCRGLEGCSSCQFNKGHLPGAVLNSNPDSLLNETEDILVYSVNGDVGADFCEQLVGIVYGNIYNLKGGFTVWDAEGFEVEGRR